LTIEEFSKINRVLIIRLSSLGDILLVTPFIRSLKIQFPSVKIDMIVRKEYSDAIKLNTNIDQKFYYFRNDDENKNLITNLSKENYDVIIDLQKQSSIQKIISSLNVKAVKFKRAVGKSFCL